jgi:hypothetical protein
MEWNTAAIAWPVCYGRMAEKGETGSPPPSSKGDGESLGSEDTDEGSFIEVQEGQSVSQLQPSIVLPFH